MNQVRHYALSWIGRVGIALAICSLVALPQSALAATQVYVDEQVYDGASSGTGWEWNGADDMALNGFVGKTIAAVGNLIITLSNENSVANTSEGAPDAAISVREGDLTITGKGELSVTSDTSGIVTDGNIEVSEGAKVDVDADNKGVSAGGDLTVDGASLDIETEDGTALKADGTMSIGDAQVVARSRSGRGIVYGKGMSVDDATVAAQANDDGIYGNGDLIATDSDITAKSTIGRAITPNGSIVIDHTNVTAETASGDMAISAWNRDDTPSTITLTDSEIVEPEGGQVADIIGKGKDDAVLVLGQTISTGAAVELGVRSVTGIESSVFIKAIEKVPDSEEDTATTDDTTEPQEDIDIEGGSRGRGRGRGAGFLEGFLEDGAASLLPKTGDPTNTLAIEMLTVGGLMLLVVSALVRRRAN